MASEPLDLQNAAHRRGVVSISWNLGEAGEGSEFKYRG